MRHVLFALVLGALVQYAASAQPTTASVSQPVATNSKPTTASRPSGSFRAMNNAAVTTLGVSLGFEASQEEASTGPISLQGGSYAVFHTSDGDILVKLLSEKAPRTVENFIGLATGKKPWKHPITMIENKTPLYNNTIIYKTVENALLYGGDPLNRGMGDPGYTLPLELSPQKGPDTPVGLLVSGLSGANASGSRWIFILRSFPDWSSKYTVFGQIVGGLDVARAISTKPTKQPTVPLDPVLINSVEILQIPVGKLAKAEFTTENGKRFLTVEKTFSDDPAAPQPAVVTPVISTTSTVETTTATKSSKSESSEKGSNGKSKSSNSK